MRTIIELPTDQLDALDTWCRHEDISRAEAIRRAIAGQLASQARGTAGTAFGVWRDKPVDGLAYQRQLRGEWDQRGAPARRKSKAR